MDIVVGSKEEEQEKETLVNEEVPEKCIEEFEPDFPTSPSSLTPDDKEIYDQEFSDSFHDGYNLAKNNPQLYEEVLWENENNKNYSSGLIWGKWLFEQEIMEDGPKNKEVKALSDIRAIRERNKDRSKVRTVEREPAGQREDLTGIRGFMDELERPAREIELASRDSERDENEMDYAY